MIDSRDSGKRAFPSRWTPAEAYVSPPFFSDLVDEERDDGDGALGICREDRKPINSRRPGRACQLPFSGAPHIQEQRPAATPVLLFRPQSRRSKPPEDPRIHACPAPSSSPPNPSP